MKLTTKRRCVLLYQQGFTLQEVGDTVGFSPGHVATILEAMDVPRRRAVKRDQRGEKNNSWKGDIATYNGFHARVNRIRGKVKQCAMCEIYPDSPKKADWANVTGEFANVYDYIPLCRSCHRLFDKRRPHPKPLKRKP